MLVYLFYFFRDIVTSFNVFRYISFRTIWAVLISLMIVLILSPWSIRKLQQFKINQHIRELGPQNHKVKAGTPTMGGLLILFAVITASIICGDLNNFYLWICLVVTLCFGIIGGIDDYLKKNAQCNEGGFIPWIKFIALTIVALVAVITLYSKVDYSTYVSVVSIPFFKNLTLDLGWGYIPLATFILVATSNAVNLTDGLDGLVAGPVLIAASTYLILAYLSGNAKFASYFQIIHVAGVGEITIFLGTIVGAVIGFLWYNIYPAQFFMGDTGSLALGGALGTAAISTKHEILLILVGGIFVVEAISVIMQVIYFKATQGRRIFYMAPLHHHFELKGWAEPKIIVRFWIVAVILAVLAISTLKLR